MKKWEHQLAGFFRRVVKFLIPLIYCTKNQGFDKIPKRGPVLLIANHVSYMDGVFIQAATDRPVRFIIDHYIYQVPLVHFFMQLNGAIPILPKKESVEKALDAISEGLENGDVVCIFPEGQLTYTGNLGRFKPGIEWIVERDPVPVYPIGIKGMWGSMLSRKYIRSRFSLIPRSFRRPVTLTCGDVLHPKDIRVNHLQRIILALLNRN